MPLLNNGLFKKKRGATQSLYLKFLTCTNSLCNPYSNLKGIFFLPHVSILFITPILFHGHWPRATYYVHWFIELKTKSPQPSYYFLLPINSSNTMSVSSSGSHSSKHALSQEKVQLMAAHLFHILEVKIQPAGTVSMIYVS